MVIKETEMKTCPICLLGNHDLVEKMKHTMAAYSDKYDYIFIKHPHVSQVLGTGDKNTSFPLQRFFFFFLPEGFQGQQDNSPSSPPQKKSAGQSSSTHTLLPSTSSQPVYLQETVTVLRNQRGQVLCHRSKKRQVAGWTAV